MFKTITDKIIPHTNESSQNYRSRIGKFQGWTSVFVNVILFIIKLVIGLITRSVSVIADAVHTLSDVISSGVVIWGFHQAEKPADVDHPYGHGRIEYIATLIIAILLIVAGVEFIESSIHRILNPEPVYPAWWMIFLIFLTIIIKEVTARYAEFLSSLIASGTLHADAWHHRIDAISSFLVVIAMVAGKFGFYALDGWMGLGVSLFIIWTGFEIAKESVDDLIGQPPTSEEIEEIREITQQIDGVLGVHDIIVHSYGHDKFISLHIELDASESQGRAHDIAEDAECILKKKTGAEPTVHIDPIQPNNPMVKQVKTFLDTRWADDDQIIGFHDIRIVDTEKHHLILFGMNTKKDMTKRDQVSYCGKIRDSLTKEFPEFDVNIKISSLSKF